MLKFEWAAHIRRPYHVNYCKRCRVFYMNHKSRFADAFAYAQLLGVLTNPDWTIKYRHKHGPAFDIGVWTRPADYEVAA